MLYKDTKMSLLEVNIMSKKQIKKLVFIGIGLIILLITGIIYSVLFNEGRFVNKMDLSEYIFSVKDIPMLMIGALIAFYVIYLTIIVFKASMMKKNIRKKYTRKVPPYFGIFGIFGFLGFMGFWTYDKWGIIYPFIFFVFFGLFGLFFEGKLSNTLEDELYQENKRKAEVKAYRTGFVLLFVVIWLVGMGMLSQNIEWCAIFMLISISLIYGLVLFLSSYLLYRYEKEE